MTPKDESELVARIATLEPAARTLDWDMAESFKTMSELSALLGEFLKARETAPAYVEPFALQESRTSFAAPAGLPSALRELAHRISASGIDTASPRFMGYIPGGGLPAAATANFVTSVFNRYVGMYGAAPGAALIENETLSWLIKTFKLPPSAWGTFCSGGSVATITAFLAARDKIPREQRGQLVCYMTNQAHFANRRALHIIGMAPEHIRIIDVDQAYRLDVAALSRAIAEDRARSLRPWLVVATAGTTNTGAIDPLSDIAALCADHSLWFHVDAAYGGFFSLVASVAPKLAAISRANSIVVDPHKGMFLPYGCGAVLVADGEDLRRSLASGGSYLADIESSEHRSANDYSIELTRPSRGAQIWIALKAHGETAIAQALEEKVLLARWLQGKLAATGRFAVVQNQDLSVVTFRMPAGNAETQRLLDDLTKQGRYLLSSTVMDGTLFIRCCVLCFRTHRDALEGLYADIMEISK